MWPSNNNPYECCPTARNTNSSAHVNVLKNIFNAKKHLMYKLIKFLQDIPDLTDKEVPRRLGPKRASKIRKLFNLSKEDDVRRFVVKRPIQKEGKPQRSKAPKIQRLITPLTLQVCTYTYLYHIVVLFRLKLFQKYGAYYKIKVFLYRGRGIDWL